MFKGLFRSAAPETTRRVKGPSQPDLGTVPRGQKVEGQGKRKRPLREARRRKQRQEEEAEEPEEEEVGPPLSKKQRKKQRQREVAERAAVDAAEASGTGKKKRQNKSDDGQESTVRPAATTASQSGTLAGAQSLLLSASAGSRTLQGRAAERLKGSRFRYLNELLYTSTGAEAKKVFDEDPTLMVAYHEGYEAQRQKWPRDPLDDVIAWLREVPTDQVVGDFGCGEARLALELSDRKVHSMDLNAVNERVTPCNLADVPLKDRSLDVACFCLALMGTDWPSFLREAHRCLRPGGLLHIAEVESRFENFDEVVATIQAIGFRQVMAEPGDFFVHMQFSKKKAKKSELEAPKRKGKRKKDGEVAELSSAGLQACNYRRR